MGASFVLGKTLVPSPEFTERVSLGDVGRLQSAAESGRSHALDVEAGRVTTDDLQEPLEGVDYVPIGLGKPMGLQILTAYSGDAPGRGFISSIFGGSRPDLLIASASKDVTTFEAAPRAVNRIKPDVADREHFGPSALSEGSPVIYYTSSLTSGSILFSVEMVVDSFDDDVFSQIKTLFTAAAGLPVFAPAAAYLMAGSVVVGIADKLGKAWLESDPFLRADLNLHFDLPPLPPAIARSVVLYNDTDWEELKAYQVATVGGPGGSARVVLVHRQTGREYQGDAPYVIVSLDGREHDELKGFAPTLATAAVLDKFYAKGTATSSVVKAVTDAMTLYNDFTFHKKAAELKQRLAEMDDPDSDQYKRVQELFEAYRKKIQTEAFEVEGVEER